MGSAIGLPPCHGDEAAHAAERRREGRGCPSPKRARRVRARAAGAGPASHQPPRARGTERCDSVSSSAARERAVGLADECDTHPLGASRKKGARGGGVEASRSARPLLPAADASAPASTAAAAACRRLPRCLGRCLGRRHSPRCFGVMPRVRSLAWSSAGSSVSRWRSSITTSAPRRYLSLSAVLIPSVTTFEFILYEKSRCFLGKAFPPPTHMGERMEPWRERPVPF